MATIGQKKREYTIRRQKEMSTVELLLFDSEAAGKAFADGMEEAFKMVEREIDMCAVNRYAFPILHVRDLIDTMLGRKNKAT